MSILFSVLTMGLFTIAGICTMITVNHHRRVEAWRNNRNAIEL